MIVNWRDLWHEELPFILVQLASFEFMVEPLDFVPIRAIQEKLTKSMNKVWLACAMDVVCVRYPPEEKKAGWQKACSTGAVEGLWASDPGGFPDG
jgi:hypothetical protein